MPPPDDLSLKIDQASEHGQEFAKLFYETFDKNRHQLKKLYMDTASIVWNGNAVSGMDAVLKFFESIPTSEHKMESLDCQPITDSVSGGQFTIVVKVYGTVKYLKRKPKTFHQNFMLTSQNNVWKIVSDSFRYQE